MISLRLPELPTIHRPKLERFTSFRHRPARPRPTLTEFAARTVNAAVAALVTVTVAATAVGFWLSYAGLHNFATRNGLHGADAWAWPASVDLFILAGELGITISAIRREHDPMAWIYLFAGFGPSVLFNVLHVASVDVWWGPYAVAASPPIAAMLALAALMRQVFKLATPQANMVVQPSFTDAEGAAKVAYERSVTGGNPLSINALAARFGIDRRDAAKVVQLVNTAANGTGGQ